MIACIPSGQVIRAHYPAELHIAEILRRGNIIIVQQKYEN